MFEFGYQCSDCDTQYAIQPDLYLCPACATGNTPDQPPRGILEVRLEGNCSPDAPISAMLPFADRLPDLPVGNTPLRHARRLGDQLGLDQLYIKDDTCNPTASFKDRASLLVAASALHFGIKEISVASTGNAGSSMAGIGAATGLNITLFLPETAPPAKMIQALQYGARVVPVRGNYDRAFDLSLEYSAQFGGINRNTGYNPLTIEGKKTVSPEIFRQLGRVPDYVFVPTGDGVILSGVYKGFKDLMKLGHTTRMPCVVAVQAAGSNALAQALETGKFHPIKSHTAADSICVDIPRGGSYALKCLLKYNGMAVVVSDEAIFAAQHRVARSTGLFCEPAAAASFAGLFEIRDTLPSGATIVCLATGHGLKDTDGARRGVDMPHSAISELDELDPS